MTTLALVALLILIALLSWLALGRLIQFLTQRKIVDTPNERSMHQGAVPRGGGIVIILLLLIAIFVLAIVSERYQVFAGLFCIVAAWAILSWWDDRHDLSARQRLFFQVVFTLLSMFAFGYVSIIHLSSQYLFWTPWLGAVATFVGIIWLANLFNFMDGMDGLAASQTIIAAITLAFWFWQAGDPHIGLLCLVLAAASYGFILRNWQPASIFMGDVGSITIGAFFAMLIVYANTRYQIPVISLVLLFGVFVFDASVTILRRIYRREKFWLPHRSHYYQRLGLAGIDHAKVVVAAVILMLFCSLIASFTVLDHDRIRLGVVLELVLLIAAAAMVVAIEARLRRSTIKTSESTPSESTKDD